MTISARFWWSDLPCCRKMPIKCPNKKVLKSTNRRIRLGRLCTFSLSFALKRSEVRRLSPRPAEQASQLCHSMLSGMQYASMLPDTVSNLRPLWLRGHLQPPVRRSDRAFLWAVPFQQIFRLDIVKSFDDGPLQLLRNPYAFRNTAFDRVDTPVALARINSCRYRLPPHRQVKEEELARIYKISHSSAKGSSDQLEYRAQPRGATERTGQIRGRAPTLVILLVLKTRSASFFKRKSRCEAIPPSRPKRSSGVPEPFRQHPTHRL
jgi:hypothetical protein